MTDTLPPGASGAKRKSAAHSFRIGTRGSDVALRRARAVLEPLRAREIDAELVIIKTAGEKKLDEPITSPFITNRFVAELLTALRKGKLHCCVVGLDELAAAELDDLRIAAVLPRDDPRDVLVVNDRIAIESLEDLPRGSRVASFSMRRRAQLLHARSDLEIVELRGDAATRIRKIDEGLAHAGIFAAASLIRLDVHQRVDAWLSPPEWLPAPAQGAIAIITRSDDEAARALVAPLDDAEARIATTAERAFAAALADGAQVPVAALALAAANGLELHGLIVDVRGRRLLRGETRIDVAAPHHSGARLALDLIDRGAGDLIAALRKIDRAPTPQPE